MKNLGYLVAFICGAGIGAGITYKLVEVKFEQKTAKEVETVRNLYLNRENEKAAPVEEKVEEVVDSKSEAEKAKNKPDILEYATELIKKEGYIDYTESAQPAKSKKTTKKKPKDYTYINPSDFGDEEEYDQIFLTYYDDGVLADENDKEIDDFVDFLGNFTTHFGEYEDDICCIRNDARKAYYEITIDHRNFSEITEE